MVSSEIELDAQVQAKSIGVPQNL